MFLKIQISLYSFQIITHVSTIYQEHCHQNIFRKCVILIFFLTWKHEKQSTGYSSYGSYICECTHIWTLKLELKVSLECK
jgi:hypothetical protein